MAKRYDQFCPIAHALSLVGERWSLLVVRELLKGPRRYTDLAGGLPGIGTNILATRLRELEAGGGVRQRQPPAPVPPTGYELTEGGARLGGAVPPVAPAVAPPPPGAPRPQREQQRIRPHCVEPIAVADLAPLPDLRVGGVVTMLCDLLEAGRIPARPPRPVSQTPDLDLLQKVRDGLGRL